MSAKPKTEKIKVEVEVLVFDKGSLFLQQVLATCKDDDGEEMEISLVNMHTPAVRYKGRMHIFALEALARSVAEAGKKVVKGS